MRLFLPVLFLFLAGSALAQPVIQGIGGIEDYQPAVAPRGFAEMRGAGFGGEETGTKVFVNGVESIVPAEFLEDGELIFQIPQQTALGAASFVVSVDGVASAPFSFPVSEYAPIIADSPIGDAYHLDGSVVSELNRAVPGEFIRVTIVTGLGAIHPPPLSITMNGLPVPIISLEDTV
ncbi:MAG: hypothetical protein ACI9OJ_005579, partial [Myxococcota bacterium]